MAISGLQTLALSGQALIHFTWSQGCWTGHVDTTPTHWTSTGHVDSLQTSHVDTIQTGHVDTIPTGHVDTIPTCGDHSGGDMFAPRQTPTLPACLEIPDTSAPLRRAPQENRQDYRPAAPIRHFNNKSLNWPSWFRHFRAVADVHGWDKNQRALQLVSYLDETAMNVAQELGDDELYDYNILVKLLGDRFDVCQHPGLEFLAGHDSFADAITELCRVGYPQSSL